MLCCFLNCPLFSSDSLLGDLKQQCCALKMDVFQALILYFSAPFFPAPNTKVNSFHVNTLLAVERSLTLIWIFKCCSQLHYTLSSFPVHTCHSSWLQSSVLIFDSGAANLLHFSKTQVKQPMYVAAAHFDPPSFRLRLWLYIWLVHAAVSSHYLIGIEMHLARVFVCTALLIEILSVWGHVRTVFMSSHWKRTFFLHRGMVKNACTRGRNIEMAQSRSEADCRKSTPVVHHG